MSNTVTIRPFTAADRAACLALFDENCPEFFAPNERTDYAAFLSVEPSGYSVCLHEQRIAGAFGVTLIAPDGASLNWILLARAAQGLGLGTMIMQHVLETVRGRSRLRISASQHSAPFFAKFGAVESSRQLDGWGLGMHRVEMQILLAG